MANLAFYAGQRITASLLASIAPIAAWKVADQSVTSNATTLIPDTALQTAVVTGGIYWVECQVKYDAASGGDIKLGFYAPGSGTDVFDWNDNPRLTAGGVLSTPFGALSVTQTSFGPGQGAGTNQMWFGKGLLTIGTLNGTFGMQFCQNTSSATATRVRPGSALIAWRLA